jgi:hypothetical protein
MTADTDDEVTGTTARTDSTAQRPISVAELLPALIWLGTTAYVAHASLTGTETGLEGALGAAAEALPGLVAAVLLTGATLACEVATRFAGPTRRLLVGLGVGAAFGLVAAAAFRFGYGDHPQITTLAAVVGAASVLGGAVAALPESLTAALLWATTFCFFVGVMVGAFGPNIGGLFGGGITAPQAAQQAAAVKVAYVAAALTGLLAGAYTSQKLNQEGVRLAWYPLGGALPGAVLLAAEGLTLIGGAAVADLVHPGDDPTAILSDASRLRHAVITVVVGALVALLAGARHRARVRAG